MSDDTRHLTPDLLDAAVDLLGRAGHGGTVRIRGSSMLPLLHEGQVVAVDFEPGRLGFGDLVLFRQVDYLVVHRLVGRGASSGGRPALRTRGDGMMAFDPWVSPERVVGRVIASQDDAGWWDLRRPGARLFGRAAGLHGAFWGRLGILAGKLGAGPRRAVGAVDQKLLYLVHRVCFRMFHRRRAPGEGWGGKSGPQT
ncbi:MAG: hypothetical protein GY716_21990 [bacterium]|nr:hypothetical protein [bacterium]